MRTTDHVELDLFTMARNFRTLPSGKTLTRGEDFNDGIKVDVLRDETYRELGLLICGRNNRLRRDRLKMRTISESRDHILR